MINKPRTFLTERQKLINSFDIEHKNTLIKLLEIQEALLYGGYELNLLNYKKNYINDYYKICLMIENENYSDILLIKSVNKLHNKMFKNRRY